MPPHHFWSMHGDPWRPDLLCGGFRVSRRPLGAIRDAVLAHLFPEGLAADTELIGGLADPPCIRGEQLLDIALLTGIGYERA